jgi:hypothetical protein
MTAKVARTKIKPGPKPKVDDQMAFEAVSLLQGGKIFNDVARTIGVAPLTLRKALQDRELKLPYQKLTTVEFNNSHLSTLQLRVNSWAP